MKGNCMLNEELKKQELQYLKDKIQEQFKEIRKLKKQLAEYERKLIQVQFCN